MDGVVDDFVGILQICQNADEDISVLGEVCARLRRQLHAAGVAFVAPDHASPLYSLHGGGRLPIQHPPGWPVPSPRLASLNPLPRPLWGFENPPPLPPMNPRPPPKLSRAGSVLTHPSPPPPRRPGRMDCRPLLLPKQKPPRGKPPLRRAIERAAAAPFAVLIEGESGSGKELVARAIHRSGPRRDRAFCTLNCAALPDDLVEAELFGHARGAFTGAVADRAGVFEEAHGGTLFLDEIGELSPRAQAKVLRVIQEGELRRVGENVSRRVDVRIVSATNRDLRQEVAAGRFRLDLLYRLDVVRITRAAAARSARGHRGAGRALLARRDRARRQPRDAAAATMAALARYDWPGNVRELQNVLAALAVRSPEARRRAADRAAAAVRRASVRGRLAPGRGAAHVRRTLRPRGARADRRPSGRAAAELGVTRQGLTKLMTRLGISSNPSSLFPVRRLLLTIPVLLGVATLVFSLIHLVPGDPVQAMLGESASPQDIAELRGRLGLDRPLYVQYGSFLKGAVTGNLGTSLRTNQPVTAAIAERLPATFELAFAAMTVAILIAIPLGIVGRRSCGHGRRSRRDDAGARRHFDAELLARAAPRHRLLGHARLAAGLGTRHAGASGAAGDHARGRRWRRCWRA